MLKIKVPATSANIGPGFDSLGFAVNLYSEFTVVESEALSITGCPDQFSGTNNLVWQTALATFDKLAIAPRQFALTIDSEIPIARGLGSSSSCIIAGILAAAYLAEYDLTKQQLLDWAVEYEGHPDNLAPAIYGGFTASLMSKRTVLSECFTPASPLQFVAFIPNFELSTARARQILPDSLSYGDAVYNISRAAHLVLALTRGNFEHLSQIVDDRLHQPYRKKLIDGYDEVVEFALSHGGYAVYLSGAGPTLMTFTDNAAHLADHFNEKPLKQWRALALTLDTAGTLWEKII